MDCYLRNANENDRDLLFNWANDEITRLNSFNIEKISYEKHIKWFEERLNSANCYIFILCLGNENIGQIRIDIKEDIGTISYSIDSSYRGKGYGNKILKLVEEQINLKKIYIYKLIAYVKFSNISSQKTFEKNKYLRVNNDKYYTYEKILF